MHRGTWTTSAAAAAAAAKVVVVRLLLAAERSCCCARTATRKVDGAVSVDGGGNEGTHHNVFVPLLFWFLRR